MCNNASQENQRSTNATVALAPKKDNWEHAHFAHAHHARANGLAANALKLAARCGTNAIAARATMAFKRAQRRAVRRATASGRKASAMSLNNHAWLVKLRKMDAKLVVVKRTNGCALPL